MCGVQYYSRGIWLFHLNTIIHESAGWMSTYWVNLLKRVFKEMLTNAVSNVYSLLVSCAQQQETAYFCLFRLNRHVRSAAWSLGSITVTFAISLTKTRNNTTASPVEYAGLNIDIFICSVNTCLYVKWLTTQSIHSLTSLSPYHSIELVQERNTSIVPSAIYV